MSPHPPMVDLSAGPTAIATLLDEVLAADPAFPCPDDRAGIIQSLAPAIWRAADRLAGPRVSVSPCFDVLVATLPTNWLVVARDGHRLELRAAVAVELRARPARRWLELWCRRLARREPPPGPVETGVA